ncbi:MAG: hypothetical protein IT428_32525 [Planctomycetaceae bacterium]|nr:hypothetical protein [Planctomycetaceae bacterium]
MKKKPGEKKPGRIGRPPKKFGKADARLVVKMPQETKDRFQLAADAARLELSVWCRQVLEDAARKQLGQG